MKLLSIDVGFVNPGIVLLSKNKQEKVSITVYNDLRFKKPLDILPYLRYFISKNIDLVIIEQQHISKNISLMSFIYGFFAAYRIEVLIKQPFAHLRENKEIKTRTAKKQFAINFVNQIMLNSDFDENFKSKDCDICDALSLGLTYLYKINKKNIKKKITEIEIDTLSFITFE